MTTDTQTETPKEEDTKNLLLQWVAKSILKELGTGWGYQVVELPLEQYWVIKALNIPEVDSLHALNKWLSQDQQPPNVFYLNAENLTQSRIENLSPSPYNSRIIIPKI